MTSKPIPDTPQRLIPTVSFSPDENSPKGLQHVVRTISTVDGGQSIDLRITLDVIVK